MNIPRKVKVGPYTYTVVRKREIKEEGKEMLGLCDREKHAIYMTSGMEKKKEKEVFLHECLHAIEDSYGISLGENKVNVLGLALMALIDDNKLRLK